MPIPFETIATQLADVGYIPDRGLAAAVWLMQILARPLLLEGEAGVGKTEVARALARMREARTHSPAML